MRTITICLYLVLILVPISTPCQAQNTEKMEAIYYSKALDTYIDLSKIVEITGLDKYPEILIWGHMIELAKSEPIARQGQYYFTIKYQLRKDVKHFLQEGEKNEYKAILNKWKNYKKQ